MRPRHIRPRLTNQPPALSSTSRPWLEYYKVFTEFVKTSIWPATIFVLLILFFNPIHRIVESFANIAQNATKVSVGSLLVEIQQQAAITGNKDLANKLGKLSPEAIKCLIERGNSSMLLVIDGQYNNKLAYMVQNERTLQPIRELAKNGLVDFSVELDSFLNLFEKYPFNLAEKKEKINIYTTMRELTPSEKQSIRNAEYALSPTGREAWNAVLNAILENLRK